MLHVASLVLLTFALKFCLCIRQCFAGISYISFSKYFLCSPLHSSIYQNVEKIVFNVHSTFGHEIIVISWLHINLLRRVAVCCCSNCHSSASSLTCHLYIFVYLRVAFRTSFNHCPVLYCCGERFFKNYISFLTFDFAFENWSWFSRPFPRRFLPTTSLVEPKTAHRVTPKITLSSALGNYRFNSPFLLFHYLYYKLK